MPEQPTIRVYADDRTQDSLSRVAPRVLLLGGYLGYPNFGDILQLKGAISLHSARARHSADGEPAPPPALIDPAPAPLEPVVVCDVGAITDVGFIDRLRERLGVEHLLFLAPGGAEPPSRGPTLTPLGSTASITHLHLYGGGYLNRLWGDHILTCVEYLMSRFGVGHYVMSGQQADAAFVERIREHVARCRPLIAGGRDDESVQVLLEAGAPAAYSFDDAAEEMELLCGRARRTWFAGAGDGAPTEETRALVHLNVSPYAAGDADAVQTLAGRLAVLLQPGAPERASGSGAPGPETVLLHAYNDERVSQVADTLGVVLRFGDRFPLSTYRVVHLGGEAFATTPADARPDRAEREATPVRDRTVGLVCSYHAAMMCQMLGVPVWLETRNEYYRQKAAGLGLVRTQDSSKPAADAAFREFLDARPLVSLANQLERRRAWLDQFARAYALPPAPRTADASAAHAGPSRSSPADCRASEHGLTGDVTEELTAEQAAAAAAVRIGELQSWIEQLEAGRAWLEEQYETFKGLAKQHETAYMEALDRIQALDKRAAALGRELLDHKTRADRAEADTQAMLNRIAQLEGGVNWLQPQYVSWRKRATELHQYVEELLPAMKKADENRRHLEDERARLESAARTLQIENAELLRELERARTMHPDTSRR